MPRKKTVSQKNILLQALTFVAGILIAIGTPPLLAFKSIYTIFASSVTKVVALTDRPKKRGRKPNQLLRLKKLFKFNLTPVKKQSARPFWLLQKRIYLLKKSRRIIKKVNLLRIVKNASKIVLLSAKSFILPIKTVIKSKRRLIKSVISKIKIPAGKPRDLAFVGVGALAFFFLFFLPFQAYQAIASLPNPKSLTARDIPISTKIFDRNGILLYQFYADENRSLVKLSDLPPYVANATIAIEDKNFYHHIGFDPAGIVRAAFANGGGSVTQGGSTITQQLIKSALLTPERTLSRKIKEVVLSIWAERVYSKNQILTMYLNQVPYGGSTFGIQSAAQTYFGKNAKDLTLAESAYLAGLPSAPSVYSPFGTRPDLARQRQKQVLLAMKDQGYITSDQESSAESQLLQFENPETVIKAPHFVMYVRDYLIKKYGSRLVEQGGLEVTTSLDYNLYEKISNDLRDGVDKQKYLTVGNGAALVTDPANGEILAMVGSRDFFDTDHDGNVNVTVAERSPGSSIKPLNYALAMEKGLITPSTIIQDTPVSYQLPGQQPYRPQNYDNHFHGAVPVRVALGSSYNIPSVRIMEKNGVANFINFAQKLGITTLIDPTRYGLSIALGGAEVKMVDMAVAYSSFANDGTKVNLKPVLKVKDYLGKTLEDNTGSDWTGQNSQKVISQKTAYQINNILSDDSARAPTFGRGSVLNIPGRQVAVKTGTTDTKRDNWTIGYTPSRLVAVWVGNNDNSPMSPFLESGNTGAAAIWNPIFQEVLKDQPVESFVPPANLIPVQICATNGLLPCDNCPQVVTEYFVNGTQPKTACKITPEERDKLLNQTKSTQ